MRERQPDFRRYRGNVLTRAQRKRDFNGIAQSVFWGLGLLGLVLVLAATCKAETEDSTLPSAPSAQPAPAPGSAVLYQAIVTRQLHPPIQEGRVERYTFLALYGLDAAARAADWASTRQGERTPQKFTEKELPAMIVSSPTGLALFEAGVWSAEVLGSRFLRHRHHSGLALALDSSSVAATSLTVVHNYSLLDHKK